MFKYMTTIVGMVIIQSFCRSHIILFFSSSSSSVYILFNSEFIVHHAGPISTMTQRASTKLELSSTSVYLFHRNTRASKSVSLLVISSSSISASRKTLLFPLLSPVW